jgi:CRISPR-associated protein (TIGR03984 family)
MLAKSQHGFKGNNMTINPRRKLNLKGVFQPLNAEDMPVDDADLTARFSKWATQFGLKFALAHADDGVIWGWFDTDWHWSGKAHRTVSPQLRLATLQQIRLFGPSTEVFLWRIGNGLAGRMASDAASDRPQCLEEPHLLWGDQRDEHFTDADGFVVWREGAMGHLHAIPKLLNSDASQRPALIVRHYVEPDKDGCTQIIGSRLAY